MPSSSRLLTVEPHEIEFAYEVGKEASCSLRISNNTTQKVAFKVKTSDPNKYYGKPAVGLILPRQTCEVVVRMIAPRVSPAAETQCKDKFVIQGLVARRSATSNDINSNMFRDAEPYVEEHELGVAYLVQSETYRTDDYVNSYIREDILGRDSNARHSGSWLVYGFLALILFSIFLKTMTLIWSLVIVLLMKAVIKIVSDLVEDWTVNALVQVIIHFAKVIYDYLKSRYMSSSVY